jgi:hypothetical protein
MKSVCLWLYILSVCWCCRLADRYFKHWYFKNYSATLHKTCVKGLNFKLYYQHLHLKYSCNLLRYWLQAPWGWHDNVETCRRVIICEIIVHLLDIVQNWNILIANCITNSCIWNICVTWQGSDYKLPEDDTIVSKHVGVW